MLFLNKPTVCVRLLNLALKPCICVSGGNLWCNPSQRCSELASAVEHRAIGGPIWRPLPRAPRSSSQLASSVSTSVSCLTDSSIADRVWVNMEVGGGAQQGVCRWWFAQTAKAQLNCKVPAWQISNRARFQHLSHSGNSFKHGKSELVLSGSYIIS